MVDAWVVCRKSRRTRSNRRRLIRRSWRSIPTTKTLSPAWRSCMPILGDSQRSSDLFEETHREESFAAHLDGARQPVRADEGLHARGGDPPESLGIAAGKHRSEARLCAKPLFPDQYDEALEIYNDIAADDPKDWQVSVAHFADLPAEEGFRESSRGSEKALEIEPKNLEVQYNDVNILESEGKTPKRSPR